jgi:hypothetical protein
LGFQLRDRFGRDLGHIDEVAVRCSKGEPDMVGFGLGAV